MHDIFQQNITEQMTIAIRDKAVAAANIVYQGMEKLPVSETAAARDWGYPTNCPGDRRWKIFATIFEDRLCYHLGYPGDYSEIMVDAEGYVKTPF